MWKLSGGRLHVQRIMSNASRTMLFNIHTLGLGRRDIEGLLDIPALHAAGGRSPQSGVSTAMRDAKFLGGEMPIAGVAGDQQSALFGQTLL